MATITRRVEVCDICREIERPVVTHMRIAPEGGRLRTYAFCATDLAPIADILRELTRAEPKADGRRGRKQVTMEQIEQIKTQRRPGRPRKKAAVAEAS